MISYTYKFRFTYLDSNFEGHYSYNSETRLDKQRCLDIFQSWCVDGTILAHTDNLVAIFEEITIKTKIF